MRLVFVTPRFRAGDATPPELLAAELASRASGGWRTTVVTTTAAGDSKEAFREGDTQDKGVRVVRFPAEVASPSGSTGQAAASLTSPALLGYLKDRSADYDLVVLFGSSAVCLGAAKLDPRRTVLLPFADQEADDSGDSEIFRYPAAFVFGSEAEEILILKRYQVHRRMRETVAGSLLLQRTADAAAFRRRTGVTGHYLMSAGPLEPGRGVEELLRFFSTFKDRHPDTDLQLVLIGPAALSIPKRPDIRIVQPGHPRERLDAVGGAFLAVIPERLATFPATAAEPFSLGVPILVNASATELTGECQASGGGLYYENYDEFELILELGLRDPSLVARMGAAGRDFLQSRHDWDRVLARYDRAFRSFARPSRTGSPEMAAGESGAPQEKPALASAATDVEAVVPAPVGEELAVEGPEGRELSAEPGEPEPSPAVSEPVDAPESSEASSPEAAYEAPEAEAAPEEEPALPDEGPDEGGESSGPETAGEDDGSEPGDDPLPSFFRGSIRD